MLDKHAVWGGVTLRCREGTKEEAVMVFKWLGLCESGEVNQQILNPHPLMCRVTWRSYIHNQKSHLVCRIKKLYLQNFNLELLFLTFLLLENVTFPESKMTSSTDLNTKLVTDLDGTISKSAHTLSG